MLVRVPAEREAPPSLAVVRRLPAARDDAALVAGLREGAEWARAELFDRYAPEVERVIRRVLGPERHTEIADVVHDAFVQALTGLGRLRDAAVLGAWMRSVAAHTACKTVRSRSRRRWLRFVPPEELPKRDTPRSRRAGGLPPHLPRYRRMGRGPRGVRAALHRRARARRGRPSTTCRFHRRLARAEARFLGAARRDPVLRRCLEEGTRWQP